MNRNVEDDRKLDIVKDYSYRELEFLIQFLEHGLLCDWMETLPYSELITGEEHA